MEFKKWLEYERKPIQAGKLHNQLLALRSQFATAAQKVYDEWVQDEDDPLNGGGICQDIAEAISDVVLQNIRGADGGTVSNYGCGEQHVWCIVHNQKEAYEVDIPYSLYERGGGYSWTKIPNIHFDPSDISISWIDPKDAKYALEFGG